MTATVHTDNPATQTRGETRAIEWNQARIRAYDAGRAAAPAPLATTLPECDGLILAEDIRAQTDLPAFDAAAVDGYAVRGPGPWSVTGTVLAGDRAAPLGRDGVAVRIATGAMMPPDADAVIRTEDTHTTTGARITGHPRPRPEWRTRGEEAAHGDLLIAATTPITPAVLGIAAAAGYDHLRVRPRPRLALVVLGSELLTSGPPGHGRIRDALGPQLPAWARRLGCEVTAVIGPIPDTHHAHRDALETALHTGADIIATTGGTMHGPVDHLQPALHALDATYLVNTVRARPGRPMLLATLPAPDGRTALLAGLPGNPQPAVLALLTLIQPAVAGLTGRPIPQLENARAGAPIPGRGTDTHLALVHRNEHGHILLVEHTSPAAPRGLAAAAGFAVIASGTTAETGDLLPLLPLPLAPGEHR